MKTTKKCFRCIHSITKYSSLTSFMMNSFKNYSVHFIYISFVCRKPQLITYQKRVKWPLNWHFRFQKHSYHAILVFLGNVSDSHSEKCQLELCKDFLSQQFDICIHYEAANGRMILNDELCSLLQCSGCLELYLHMVVNEQTNCNDFTSSCVFRWVYKIQIRHC